MHEDVVAESTVYAWKEILKKDGYAVKEGWPKADVPDILLLKKPRTYLQELIVSIRKQLLKKSNTDASNEKKRPMVSLIYVADQYDGWEEKCLEICMTARFQQTNSSYS
ncbi:hypothetical protein RHMOL_Rhmol13G0302800 [Rhododendron molle]|uniref:Uncharacterized protein n=1 Tax=Rhododendron molle TaxID=49168 RepID=A0ACC0LCC6_RHOML|nr:hypothetical protein RHMOL_Rhmol13G0302800 [Rhododendron molle]